MRMKNEAWDQVIQTNLNAAFYTCRAVCRGMMKERFGRIINLSSIVGIRGQAGQTNYSAAKAGVIGLSKALAQELASRNITVNVIAPGYIETDINRAYFASDAGRAHLEAMPRQRLGAPEDLDGALMRLVSSASRFITGPAITVDVGQTLKAV